MPPVEIVPSLPRLVAAGVFDAQLAALAWLLLDDGVPVLVAVPGDGEGNALLDGNALFDGGDLLDSLVAALSAERRPDLAVPAERRPDAASPAERRPDLAVPAERRPDAASPAERRPDAASPAERRPDAASPAERRPDAASPAERRPDAAGPGGATATGRVVRVPETLSIATPPGPLRAALSATTGRSGLAAAVDASDLAAVLAVLRRQGLSDDEISFLGVVLVLGASGEPAGGGAPSGEPAGGGRAPSGEEAGGGGGPSGDPGGRDGGPSGQPARDVDPARIRVVAAHYLRPVARDAAGHVQRLGPAVLATWDAGRAAYDHFAWGIYPELAARTGRRAGDFEREHDARRERLQSDVERGPA